MAKTIDLLELSDSQKIEYLGYVKAYLRQQIDEQRFCNSISLQSFEKNSVELECSSPIEGKHNMSSLKETIERIRSLEDEKRSLLREIDELKEMADAKATNLESELSALRDEVRSLKNLLQGPEQNENRKLKR
jgi:predicted RNase H-like nuclease (RuvC/YqgF family)